MKNLLHTTNSGFYDNYKPLPTASKSRIGKFRKRLLYLQDVPRRYLRNSSNELVRINISTPILRSQEERKIGKMEMFDVKKKDKTTKTMKFFPIAGAHKLKESPEESKQIARMTISKKKLQRSATLAGFFVAYKDETLHASPKCSTFTCKEDYHKSFEKLYSNKIKLEKTMIKAKIKKAVKYLVGIASKRKEIIRGIPSITISERKAKEPQIPKIKMENLKPPMIIIHQVETSSTIEENNGITKNKKNESDNIYGANNGILLSDRSPKRESANKKRRNTMVVQGNMNSLIGKLEKLALEPIKMEG